MCPNDQVLSAYFDAELEGEWQRQVANHVSECTVCQQKINNFSILKDRLQKISVPATSATSQSVVNSYIDRYSREPFLRTWERKVSVPFPLVMAASFLMLAMGLGILAQNLLSAPARQGMPVVDSVDGVSVEKLAELIEFLDSQDAVLEMRITLPEDNDFAFSMGEPRLLKAAEFQRAP